MVEIFVNFFDIDGLYFIEVMEGYVKNWLGVVLIKDFKEWFMME